LSVIALTFGASAVAGYAFQNAGVALISLGFLFVSLSRYFLPSAFLFDPSGARVSHAGVTRFFPWSRFRRVALRPDGIFLGTFSSPRRLDAWRGIYVRSSRNRDQVLAYARAHIGLGTAPRSSRPRSGNAASS
jgi:hypothetical protein